MEIRGLAIVAAPLGRPDGTRALVRGVGIAQRPAWSPPRPTWPRQPKSLMGSVHTQPPPHILQCRMLVWHAACHTSPVRPHLLHRPKYPALTYTYSPTNTTICPPLIYARTLDRTVLPLFPHQRTQAHTQTPTAWRHSASPIVHPVSRTTLKPPNELPMPRFTRLRTRSCISCTPHSHCVWQCTIRAHPRIRTQQTAVQSPCGCIPSRVANTCNIPCIDQVALLCWLSMRAALP